MSDMTVAKNILRQLGGRLVAMTGARDLIGGDNYLMFRLPTRLAAQGINKVKITLDPTDTYTVDFMKMSFKSHSITTVVSHSLVYDHDLQRIFTKETGLALHL